MGDELTDLGAHLQLGPKQAGAGLRARSVAAANRSDSPHANSAGGDLKDGGFGTGSSYSRVSLGPSAGNPAGKRRESAYRSRFTVAKAEAETLRESYGDATNMSTLVGDQTTLDFDRSKMQSLQMGTTAPDQTEQHVFSFTEGEDDGDNFDKREQLRSEHEQSQLELMQLLDKMRDDPDSSPFHYLSRFPIDDFPANPYHLKVNPSHPRPSPPARHAAAAVGRPFCCAALS